MRRERIGSIDALPSPEQVAAGEVGSTNLTVYYVLLFASLAFGCFSR